MRTGIRGLVLALALSPSPGAAQAPEWRFFLDAGVMRLTSDAFTDYWRNGGGIGAGAEYPFAPVVSLWGRVGFNRFMLDEEEAAHHVYTQGPLKDISGGALTIWGVQVGARLRPASGNVRPYLDLGAGVETFGADDMRIRYSHWQTGEETSYVMRFSGDTKPSVTVGAGLTYAPRPSFALFAAAHADAILTEGEETHYFPISVRALSQSTHYFSIRVGVLLQ